MHTIARAAVSVLLALGMLVPAGPTAASLEESGGERWRAPVPGSLHVAAPFRAPAHTFGAGHRGVDLTAPIGTRLVAPASGVVAFRGTVVDRPLLTIEHPGGYVTTFEPLTSGLSPGDHVVAGDEIGVVAVGGHTSAGSVHVGVRLNGAYINPMLLFGEVQRAVLLPCCAPL